MLHEQVLEKSSFDRVKIAAVWPAGPQLIPLPLLELEEAEPASNSAQVSETDLKDAFVPTPAAPDVPAAVGGMIVAAYAALIGAFFVATAGSAQSIFAITISALFVLIFFAVPRIFLAVEPKTGRRPSFDQFMRKGMETLTGHNTGGAALVQMLIVPVFLTFAALAMGIARAIYI